MTERAIVRARWCALGAAVLAAPFLCAAAPAPAPAAIEIAAATSEGRLSPLLYGQFLEFMFEGIKRGLHAELLRNRSFEEEPDATGLSRYWERYPDRRNDDYAISFSRDAAGAFPPAGDADGALPPHALRVELRPGVVARHGVYQARVPVRHGIEYHGYVWIRTESFTGRVTVAIEADASGGRLYDEAAIAGDGRLCSPRSPAASSGETMPESWQRREAGGAESGEWKKCEFVLRPAAADPLARFAILFTGSGTVWIDHVSLMPGDARETVRADVMEKVAALAPAFIRWPGGNVAQDYHWQWAIGPRDQRPPWVNLAWKNDIEPGDFGTDDFIRFARAAGAEPSITVNVEGRGATAEEAAAWVEYCNAPPSSRYGAARARNGHPEPYAVKYWEIGNEIFGDWVRGHTDAATYARRFDRYVAAMRAVDRSIQVIAVGDNDLRWDRTVLQSARERVDFLAVHHYYGGRDMDGDLRNLLARPLHYERWYADLDAVLRELPLDRRPSLAVNEWGLDLPEPQQYSIAAALYAARLMNVFERRSDLIAMSAVSDLVNGWPGGIIQAASDAVFVTPIYLVNRLYAAHAGAERLAVSVAGPAFSTTREGNDVPALDVVASRSADGGTITVKAVNADLEHAHPARITVRGATVKREAVVERVVADSLTAANGFRTPDAVKVTRASIPAGNIFSLELPRHSVSVVTLTVAR